MKEFLPFEEARAFVRSLNLKGYKEWKDYRSSEFKPTNIPFNIRKIYRLEWISWFDFLGTQPKPNFLLFEEAREFVRSLKLKNCQEWKDYYLSGLKPINIPANIRSIYSDKWISWFDFLGFQAKPKFDFLPFEEAREFARSLKFKTIKEWQIYCGSGAKPKAIPSRAEKVYENQWISYMDWLGYKGEPRKFDFLPFEEARKFVRSLKLKGHKEWRAYRKGAKKGIPVSPDQVYKDQWISYGDWLGYESCVEFRYLSFKEAKEYVKNLGLKDWEDWMRYCRSGKKLSCIPLLPNQVYKKEWVSMKDFLGIKFKNVTQRILYDIVCNKYYPNVDEKILKEKVKYDKFPPIIKEICGRRLQLDIWLPELNIGFEYQGEQHYGLINYIKKYWSTTIESDARKREACFEAGINLILIDYRWNRTIEGLEQYYDGTILPLIVGMDQYQI